MSHYLDTTFQRLMYYLTTIKLKTDHVLKGLIISHMNWWTHYLGGKRLYMHGCT